MRAYALTSLMWLLTKMASMVKVNMN